MRKMSIVGPEIRKQRGAMDKIPGAETARQKVVSLESLASYAES
jgi:hypothetical protein